tara:strand:- start:869 stop:2473 length:1605 start_codon:yes stop_codon:yes gene_type:complete
MKTASAYSFLFLLILFTGGVARLEAGDLVRPDGRIVFIGDSITGQGGRGTNGWMALIGRALQETNPANQQTLVPLGGSGHRVGSWANVERKSREADVFLDIKEFNVREELDQPAGIVVIMLGMNDVLSAGLADTDEGLENWKEAYRGLIQAVRKRATPRVLALATPTPCTEDPASPKNRVMDRMVEKMTILAGEENCLLLPTRAVAWEILDAGRGRNSNFHITSDQVHPNRAGHAMIAAGMLRGLGEKAASDWARQLAIPSNPESLTATFTPLVGENPAEPARYQVTVSHPEDGQVSLELPEGWKSISRETGDGESAYVIEEAEDGGPAQRRLVVRQGEASCALQIPAPWLVGFGNAGAQGWKGGKFEVETGRLPSDEFVRTGSGIREAIVAGMELSSGAPVAWQRFTGNLNYGGGGAPEVVDFAALTYFRSGHTGYGMRWIHSPAEQPVLVRVSRPGFAGVTHAEVWLNGATVYSGPPEKANKQDFPATLQSGWNLVSFKSNFLQWQWQLSVGVVGADGEELDGLRYAILPAR